MGQFASFPTIWGLPPAVVEETRCQAEGADSCHYRLRWTNPVSNVRIPLGALVGALLGVAIAALGHAAAHGRRSARPRRRRARGRLGDGAQGARDEGRVAPVPEPRPRADAERARGALPGAPPREGRARAPGGGPHPPAHRAHRPARRGERQARAVALAAAGARPAEDRVLREREPRAAHAADADAALGRGPRAPRRPLARGAPLRRRARAVRGAAAPADQHAARALEGRGREGPAALREDRAVRLPRHARAPVPARRRGPRGEGARRGRARRAAW